MLGVGRRGLFESFARFGSVPLSQAAPWQNLATFNAVAPVSTALRTFASKAKYDPQGDMNAVTFHGPRSVKVSRKPKPTIQEPGVSA